MANLEAGSQKTKLKKVKSSIKLQNVFRRVSQGSKNNDNDTKDSSTSTSFKFGGGSGQQQGSLFGINLDELCGKEGQFPVAVQVRYIFSGIYCTSLVTHLEQEPVSSDLIS